MALNPQIIGKDFPHGFAGCFARQPDMIVQTRPAGGEANIPFGAPLVYGSDGKSVEAAGAGFAAANFVGVAGFEIKSALNYLDQTGGNYAPGEAVSVFQRGSINVKAYGTPALGGTVYVRVNTSETYTDEPVGAFTATQEDSDTVALTNCQWGGPADENGIAELVILTRNKA
ncbi:MAG TPA: hypothetical protein IAC21_06750 [Candidatus Enterenecus merdae]|nr:hypothetical protein [Candidatus Enterenecus merdae]